MNLSFDDDETLAQCSVGFGRLARRRNHNAFGNCDPCLLEQFLRLILVDLHSYTVLIEEKRGTLAASSARLSITGYLFTARQGSIPGGRSDMVEYSLAESDGSWNTIRPVEPSAASTNFRTGPCRS